jgi:hypothetical protein
MKEKLLQEDLSKLDFDPKTVPLDEYIIQFEKFGPEMNSFVKKYEWLKSIGVSPRHCFSVRLRGILVGMQAFNEPVAYSGTFDKETAIKLECLVQRGCTISWAHEHLGSKMLMTSIRWMLKNTSKRVFYGYSDPSAGEIGTIYQACNFKYLGNTFGSDWKYTNPKWRDGKEFCAHSLRRTSLLKQWCKWNNIDIQLGWLKSNGFKDLSKIPDAVKQGWYAWGNDIIKNSTRIPVDKKGKYVYFKSNDRTQQKFLDESFKDIKFFPYPKRNTETPNT